MIGSGDSRSAIQLVRWIAADVSRAIEANALCKNGGAMRMSLGTEVRGLPDYETKVADQATSRMRIGKTALRNTFRSYTRQ